MTIEVIRIIRYRYETVERMTSDMEHWTLQGPAGNARTMQFTSTHLPPIVVEQETQAAVADAIQILDPDDRDRCPTCKVMSNWIGRPDSAHCTDIWHEGF